MMVPAVPTMTVRVAFDLTKLCLGCTYYTLVDKGQKYLCGFIAGAGVVESHIHLPSLFLQNGHGLCLDGTAGLFIWLPAPAAGQPVFLVYTVRSADGKAVLPQEIVILSIRGEQKVGILRLEKNCSTAKKLFLIDFLCDGALCMVYVDTEECERQFGDCLF